MNARELVAWNMRRLRVAAGFSQEKLGDAAGVDRTYVSRLERKMENPSIGVLEKISEALGVHISEMFAEPDPNEKAPKPLKAGRRPNS
ncbi:helix-turn-helix domain-containing protein [Pelagibacterium mangrovi]|uniref:helix-turn-helix domain-containing protein n=1 Tax=Pelagibacterium mangrovi TaxID=3119828 RepID=UPI002FCB366D